MDILEILGKIGFDWKVFLFNLVNFLIVAFLLQKFFFRKVMKTIEDRKELIANGIRDAELVKTELSMANQKREEIIKDAEKDANEIIRTAVENGEQVSETMRLQTEEELKMVRQKSLQQIEEDRKRMVSDFRREAGNLVMMATRKLVSDKSKNVKDEELEESLLSFDIK